VTLNWGAPANNGGYTIIGYRIEISSDNTSWRTYASASADTTTLSMTDVVTGTPFADEVYFFRVRAESSAGAGQTSVGIPVAPRRATQPARTQAVLENNAEPTSAFAGEQSVLSAVAATIDSVARTYAVGGVPGRVDSLIATPTNGGLTITWNTPTETGTSAITSYVLMISNTDGSTFTTVNASATSPAVVTGLTAGTQYHYRVYAVNASGNGTPTSVLAVAGGNTAGNFASAPTGTNATAGTIPVSGNGNIASYTSAVLADAPTGFWALSDASGATSVADAGSAGAPGTPTSVTFGGGSNTSPLGSSQLTASFNGASSKIVVPDNAAWNSSSLTVEAWIKPGATQTTNYAAIFSRNSANNGWFIEQTNAGQFFAWINGVSVITASGVITPNRWQHIAMTYNGNVIKLFVNGVVLASVAAPNIEVQTQYDSGQLL
jgi:hypothetical protein